MPSRFSRWPFKPRVDDEVDEELAFHLEMRTREYIERGESEGHSLVDAMRDGALDGMQHFDGELERLVREGVITFSSAMLYATNAGNLRIQMADVADDEPSLIVQ